MAELETIARPYAKALHSIVKESPNEAKQWETLLYVLKESMDNPDLVTVLDAPDFSLNQRVELLADISNQLLNRDITDKEVNFLRLICKNKRYAALPIIYEDFRQQLLAEQGVIQVLMQSAYKLTKDEETMFVEALGKRFNKKIELNVTLLPSLLGGAILEIDDLVIDGSILGRLNNMIRSVN